MQTDQCNVCSAQMYVQVMNTHNCWSADHCSASWSEELPVEERAISAIVYLCRPHSLQSREEGHLKQKLDQYLCVQSHNPAGLTEDNNCYEEVYWVRSRCSCWAWQV